MIFMSRILLFHLCLYLFFSFTVFQINVIADTNCKNDSDVINHQDCYKVCSDLHVHKKGIDKEFDINTIVSTDPRVNKKTYYTGDIFDYENAAQRARGKKRKKEAEDIVRGNIKDLQRLVGKENFVRGNHEMNLCVEENCPKWTIINGILFTHGHINCWHDDRVKYWEFGKKREYKKGCYTELKPGCVVTCKQGSIDKFLKRFNKVHTIVYGHTHRDNDKKIKIKRPDGSEGLVRLLNVNTGCTYVNLAPPTTR